MGKKILSLVPTADILVDYSMDDYYRLPGASPVLKTAPDLREWGVREGSKINTKMSLAQVSTGCVTLSKSLHLSEPHFSNL